MDGPRADADRALARLQDTCAEVAQSCSTLEMPLLAWQAPWFSDDSTKRAAKAVLNRVAAVHTVWWDLAAATQAARDVPSGAQPLLSLTVNGHLIQACIFRAPSPLNLSSACLCMLVSTGFLHESIADLVRNRLLI